MSPARRHSDSVYAPLRWRRVLVKLLLPLMLIACQTSGPRVHSPPLRASVFDPPQYEASVQSMAVVPAGWSAEPLKHSDRHWHQVWISPTKKTAYGIVRMKLPLPVGPQLVLPRFLNSMRETEGRADLVGQPHFDPQRDALRFEALGGKYHVWAMLTCRGFSAWAVYAATPVGQTPDAAELKLAEQAREHTQIDAPRAAH